MDDQNYEVEDSRLYNGDHIAGVAMLAAKLVDERLHPGRGEDIYSIAYITAMTFRYLISDPRTQGLPAEKALAEGVTVDDIICETIASTPGMAEAIIATHSTSPVVDLDEFDY